MQPNSTSIPLSICISMSGSIKRRPRRNHGYCNNRTKRASGPQEWGMVLGKHVLSHEGKPGKRVSCQTVAAKTSDSWLFSAPDQHTTVATKVQVFPSFAHDTNPFSLLSHPWWQWEWQCLIYLSLPAFSLLGELF